MFVLSQFPLPYSCDAMSPFISDETMRLHHDKHLATYIKNLNELIADTEYANMPLEKIVVETANARTNKEKKIFNNAAQVYNHNFYFHCMRRDTEARMPYEIAKFFGGEDVFHRIFKDAALSLFGSGWVWLVKDKTKYKVITTSNAGTPITMGWVPLLTLDIWEHAYYLDYQNKRADFIEAFLEHLINWDFVTESIKD